MANIIKICEVCDNKKLLNVLDLGDHPLCDDLLEIGSKRDCVEYPIKIAFCEKCFTAHQIYQVTKQTLFSENYHYRARMTGSVLAGMLDLVNSCEKNIGNLKRKTVLDIGCNDGSLLNFFKDKGCNTIGVEPTKAAQDSEHLTLNKFFDITAVKEIIQKSGYPDIITFTNVFAHIEDLPTLIDNLKQLIKNETVLVIENHYLGAVLKTGQFDTFYHEHPRTYSFESFKYIAKSLNLNIQNVQFVSRYGGNIRVFLGQGEPTKILVDESEFGNLFVKMNDDIKVWIDSTTKKINNLVRKYGPLRAKAFPGRAAILVKLLNLNENQISAVYEIKGSIKTYHYVPGTKIPILPEEELYLKKNLNLPIINLAWHLPNEVRANLKSNRYSGEVIDIKDMLF